MNRRGFLGFLGGTAAAASVKQAVTLPETPDAVEKFAGGVLKQPRVDLTAGLQQWAGNWYDVQDGILYDRVRFPAGATLPNILNFFATPLGQRCPYTNETKTFLLTNMGAASCLSAPREFLARRIIFAVHPSTTDADIDLISGESYWDLWLGQKTMAKGPMLLNGPTRAELEDLVTEDGKLKTLPADVLADSRDHGTMGGLLIPTLMYFSFQLTFPNYQVTLQSEMSGGRGLDLLIGFVGLDARGVQ